MGGGKSSLMEHDFLGDKWVCCIVVPKMSLRNEAARSTQTEFLKKIPLKDR